MLHLTESYAIDCYQRVFQAGIEEYESILTREVIKHIPQSENTRVLDIGCGVGQWALAAAKINPAIEVVGVDVNQYSLDLAKNYADKHNISNIRFLRLSYDELLEHLAPESFEAVLCNSVLQYIDTQKAFETISRLLKPGGVVLSMWNHHVGYYIKRLIRGIYRFKPGDIIFALNTILRNSLKHYVLNSNTREHLVSYWHVRRIGQRNRLRIQKVPFTPLLDYKEKYLWVPEVWNFRGIKS